MKKLVNLLVVVLVSLTALTGCGVSFGDSPQQTKKRTLTILAASSLTETFDKLAADFKKQHPDVTVKLVYDSSATLAQQAEQGAPGDILATADQKTMDDAKANKGTTGTPYKFATNVVTLAVPAANPAGVTSLADLDKASVKYVVCVQTAPCGAAADALLTKNGVTKKPVSEEVDVKSVLAKVTGNEADAGLVYKTDVIAAGDAVKGFEVPGASEAPNTYWVAVTSNRKVPELARDWIKLIKSPSGQNLLADAGFGKP
ncbi:MAG: modA [Nocardioidaceae bacterium]|nr:modA [Nocardioidaceae bacterium]